MQVAVGSLMWAPANITGIPKNMKHACQHLKILFYIAIVEFMMYKIQQSDRLNIYSEHTKDLNF